MSFFNKHVERVLFPCQKKLDTILKEHGEACEDLCSTLNQSKQVVVTQLLAARGPSSFQKAPPNGANT